MIVEERIFCNTCAEWSPPPYRRGKCSRCTGVRVGGLLVCCGDCDRYPCDCPQMIDDRDVLIARVA